MAIYLKNAVYVDWQSLEFKTGHIQVEEGINGGLRFFQEDTALPASGKGITLLDCTGKLVMKSFACGHHHVYSALARGMGAPKKIPHNFYEILQYVWWTLDKCLDLEMIEASALVTAMACAKNGVTFVIDHHASPFCIKNSLETIAAAFDKVGVSHLLCYELSDRDGETSAQQGLEETENYLKNQKQGLVGLHASFTVGDELLSKAVQLAEKYKSGIHVHVAEDPYDQDHCLKNYQKRVIPRLFQAGVLNFNKTILAHCLHLDYQERELLQYAPVYIAQNTESNLNNNVGTFTPAGLNGNILLGTDGMYSDMLRSAKAAYMVGQKSESASPKEIYTRLRRVHHYLQKNSFTGDGENNLVICDYDSPTPIHCQNFYGHFIYGLESRHIQHVISAGRLIVKNQKVTTVNETTILTHAREMAKKLWQKMADLPV